jgi:hypothetical protein
MCIGTDFAMAGFDMITDAQRRREVRQRLSENGRTLVELTAAQIGEFAGNALELQGSDGRLLALEVPTIELAGGSVRCMLAGIHLKPRPGQRDASVE